MKQGVPRGGVLSLFLFNLYMTSLPSPPEDVKIITHADITITSSGPDVKKLAVKITECLKVSVWLKSRNLVLSAVKSTATIFTTWSNEVCFEPEVYINEEKIAVTETPKVLGVVFDNMLKFTQHVKKVCEISQNRNNLLKKLLVPPEGAPKKR